MVQVQCWFIHSISCDERQHAIEGLRAVPALPNKGLPLMKTAHISADAQHGMW